MGWALGEEGEGGALVLCLRGQLDREVQLPLRRRHKVHLPVRLRHLLHLRHLVQGDAEVVSDVALGRAGLVKDLVVEPDAGLPVLVLPRLLRLRMRGGRGPSDAQAACARQVGWGGRLGGGGTHGVIPPGPLLLHLVQLQLPVLVQVLVRVAALLRGGHRR